MVNEIRVSVLVAALSFAFGALAAAAPDRGEERIWTGTNGSSFRGTYVESMGQGGKIRFITTAGKAVTVAFGNLSEADRKIIEGFEGKATGGAETRKPDFDPDKFKELPAADRNLMPERKPEDFGGENDGTVTNALWISLLWWNAFEVMPIPKKGDFDSKAEWLMEELTRYLGEHRYKLATEEETKEGVEKYFLKRLEDTGACKVYTLMEAVTRDQPNPAANDSIMSPLSLSRLTKGNDIVIIRLGTSSKRGMHPPVGAAIENIHEDGTFSMHIYGKRLSGKMIEVTKRKPGDRVRYNGALYEFVVNNRDDLPKFYVDEDGRFFIYGDTSGTVLRPYVYKTLGEPAPLPKD